MLLIREQEARTLVSMTDALDSVERAFVEQALGTGINQPRQRTRQPGGILHMLCGALTARGYWGYKAYTSTRSGTRFTVTLYDVQSGELLTTIEADYLGQLRTGAASGIATRVLARPDAAVLALFGTGFQAETQLEAIAAVRQLRDIRAYSPTTEKREAFAERMGERLGLPVHAVSTPEAALDGADIVTTATTARSPLFAGNQISPGTHINAAGSNSIARVELDHRTIRRADRIFTDDVAQARSESGDLVMAYERNALAWEAVRPLADVVAGLTTARGGPDEITLFESQGIALWDIALAATIYERARQNNIGSEVAFGP